MPTKGQRDAQQRRNQGLTERQSAPTYNLISMFAPPQDEKSPESSLLIGRSTQRIANRAQIKKITEDVPDEYLCKLTYAIMKKPVFDPNTPDIKFERKAIETALKIKDENPFTRQYLTPDMLVPDKILRKKIRLFLSKETKVYEEGDGQNCSFFCCIM